MSSSINRRRFLKTAGIMTIAAATGLSGCTTQAPPAVETEAAPANAPEPTTAPVETGPAKEFRYLAQSDPAGSEDGLVQQVIEEALNEEYNLNIKFKWDIAPDYSAADLRLQTQEVDGMQAPFFLAQKYITQPGLLMEIDDLVAKIGDGNLHDNISKAAWDYVGRDGKKVCIPGVRSANVDCEYIYIRRDWLDELNRDVPTTFEDFEECLRLFKEKNLGGETTIPLAIESPDWLLYENTMLGAFAPEYEEQMQMMEKGENLEFQYGLNFRPLRMEMLSRWYKDGLLNPEFAVWASDQTWDAVGRGLVGAVSAGWWNQGTLRDIEKADPKQDWVQIYPPLGLKGKPNTNRVTVGQAIDRATFITSWAKAPEALIALFDWNNSSFENYTISRNGIEGKHWERDAQGRVSDLRSPAPNQEFSGTFSTVSTRQYWIQGMFEELEMEGMAIKQLDLLQLIFRGPFTRKVAHIPENGEYPTINRVDCWCPYQFTESAKYTNALETLRNEYVIKIIKGEVSVESGIPEFWDRWMQAGGETRMKEITTQFNSWIAAHPEWKDPKAILAPESWLTGYTYPEKKTG